MDRIKILLLKYKWKVAGIFLGLLAGFAYWYFIGCTSGTCPIQSHWQSSSLYGALIGLVLAPGSSKPKKEKKQPD